MKKITLLSSLLFGFIFHAQVANQPSDLIVCDDDNDGFSAFDLTYLDAQVLNDQDPTQYIVSYYEALSNAENAVNPIVSPYYNTTQNIQTIYVRVEELSTGNYATTSFDIIVNPLPSSVAVLPYQLCDSNNPGDEQELFDLTTKDIEILNGQTNVSVTYYQSQMDADTITNAINGLYTNTSNPQAIYARLTNTITGCSNSIVFNLIVNSIPIPTQPTPLELCDDNTDGIEMFDLSVSNAEIVGGNTNLSIAYFLTEMDAQSQINPLPTIYTNTSNPTTLFVRVTDVYSGCVGFTTLTLRVLPNPSGAMGTPNDIEVCDDNNDGFAIFDLTINEAPINPSGEPFSISYFLSLEDANSDNNAILNPNSYTNGTNPQPIYVRVESLDGCYSVVNFDIIVNPLPQLNIESSYAFCVGNSFVLDTELSETDFNFVWYRNGNYIVPEPGASYTITQPGSYQIQATSVTSGCFITTTTNVEEVVCTDTDNDGVIDSEEDLNNNGNLEDDDTDMDMIPNYLDDDDDGDGVDTIAEINSVLSRNTIHPFVDTDNDLIENYLDDDDDGDNILTIDEDYNNNGDPTDDDTDMSGIPDYLEANVALGINEYSLNNFQLYPNPANNRITIQLTNSNFETGNLNIYNIQGKMIYKDMKLVEQVSTIDISNLEHGLYFLELTLINTSIVQKLIVN